jgi:tetratricopeptide (TPR) repeat protein
MNFRKVNNITGWAVFLVALITYMLTREARGSLWDCGEFVASANGLQLPHPPGAPLFTLLGRFFIILFGDNPQTAASAVNFMSALASAGTILFLFWSVTHFARKMFVKVGEDLTPQQIFTVMTAGAVGGLAYTFSDSFWFSAVEGEVYALSSFFTALVFWAILKWEHADEHAGNDPAARLRSERWIIFLFFMMGLSIGVHLLNLLTIPAIVMVYYYRRYTASVGGSILAFLIGCLITGVVQVAIIQYSMKAGGLFDVFFVNEASLPFFSGFAIYFILVAAVIAWGLTFKERNTSKAKLIIWFFLLLGLSFLPFFTTDPSGGKNFLKFMLVAIAAVLAGYFIKSSALRVLKLILWCYVFMMLGYFMYFTSIIRSNANPSIDMNNVDNPINLVYYLSREQYGSAPLVWGPHFAATRADLVEGDEIKEGEMKYIKGEDRYIPIGREREYNYKSSVKQLFPRVWDPSNDQFHATFYAQWLGLGQDPQTGSYEAPSYGDNLEWFFTYQMSLMYWRYFMWNFAGKQNDVQGLGNARDGNWITGISVIDNARLGDQDQLPDSIKKSKAHNTLYLLPFILGIIGCVYQAIKNRKDWIVTFLLFFFTGIAVVLYLNQPGNQPRERDYAYVGSFYVFAIWIGLAVVAFVKMAREKADKKTLSNVVAYGAGLTFIIMIMSSVVRGSFGGIFLACALSTVLYIVVTLGITYLLRAISSAGQNLRIMNIGAAVLCGLVPLFMAQQEWDDHDRSSKTLAPDLAKDYLESCAPNAIIFTFGDNDTYPLWYAQEVEGVRPDIRIINNSLLGIDWYINQLRYTVNKSAPLDIIFTPEQIEGHNREYFGYGGAANNAQSPFYDLRDVLKELAKPNIDPETKRDVGVNRFPVSRLGVPVDEATVRANGTVNPEDSIESPMLFEIPKNTLDRGLYRSDLIILAIIATNQWKRPIYFTSPYGELGFWNYLRKDGLAYRLVPVISQPDRAKWVLDQSINRIEQKYRTGIGGTQIMNINKKAIYDNLMNRFGFGGADKKGTYFDEENRRHLLNIRSVYGETAGILADNGDKEKAKQLLEKAEAGIDPENLPYAMVSRFNSHNQTGLLYLEALYKAGMMDKAEKVRQAIRKDFEEQKKYYEYLRDNKPELYSGTLEGTEVFLNNVMLEVLADIEQAYSPNAPKQPGTQPEVGGGIINNNPADTVRRDTTP